MPDDDREETTGSADAVPGFPEIREWPQAIQGTLRVAFVDILRDGGSLAVEVRDDGSGAHYGFTFLRSQAMQLVWGNANNDGHDVLVPKDAAIGRDLLAAVERARAAGDDNDRLAEIERRLRVSFGT